MALLRRGRKHPYFRPVMNIEEFRARIMPRARHCKVGPLGQHKDVAIRAWVEWTREYTCFLNCRLTEHALQAAFPHELYNDAKVPG